MLLAVLLARRKVIGRTHLVKGIYLLGALLGVPVGWTFEIYHYGPYSGDAHRTIRFLAHEGFIEAYEVPRRKDERYGLSPSAMHEVQSSHAARSLARQLEFVAGAIARWDILRLEAVTTAIWYRREFPRESPSEIASRVRGKKTRLDPAEALEAVTTADHLIARAISTGLIAAPPEATGLDNSTRVEFGLVADALDNFDAEVALLLSEAEGAAGVERPGESSRTPAAGRDVLICGDAAPLVHSLSSALVSVGLNPIVAGTRGTGGVAELRDAIVDAAAVIYVAAGKGTDPAPFLRAVAGHFHKALVVRAGSSVELDLALGELERIDLDPTPQSLHEVLNRLNDLTAGLRWEAHWWEAFLGLQGG